MNDMRLVAFIEARLADAEHRAVGTAREVRGVLARRVILREHLDHPCAVCEDDVEGCPTLRALAYLDADHPDYDPAWSQFP